MEYAAAIVTFVDRDSGEIKTTYLYPIIEIKLMTNEAKEQETLKVIDGKWSRALEGAA